ncbi:MAG: exodeoxyribonuclease V subunit gamma [Elusimicrobia bacterium]|nr:exodeoxyribonuclease V subunit gamma [Elusimicrobiota bacterium]
MRAERGGLSVVHGPFEALEDAFAARVRALLPEAGGKPLLVVAPSRVMTDRLERLLAVEKGLPLLGVHFHTFHSLAAAVVEEGGFPDAALVSDPVFHDAVVDRVLDKAPSLGIAKELRPKALASAVRSSLRDLIDSGVDPRQVAEHFGSTLLKDEEEAGRLNALLALLALYEKELSRLGVQPPSALVKQAAAYAPDSEWLSGFSEILYYGFYDLTGLQLDFFESVTNTRPSKLYFPFRQGYPAFRFSEELFDQKFSGRSSSAPAGAAGGTALGEALDSLFDPSKPPVPVAPGRVVVVSASGARDESWAAAKEVLRLLGEGIPPHEIAVVARSLEPYRPALAEVFSAEGLPLDLSCGEPVLRHPAAKAALDLLTLRERDFPARTVSDLAGSPYFIAADPARASRWRRLVEALGIRAGWLQWRGKLEPRVGAPVELRPHRVREGLPGELIPAADAKALWDLVSGLRETLGAPPASWSARAAEARALLSAHLRLPADASPAERDAWGAVQDALEELSGFDRLREESSWEAFLDAFERKLSRATRDAGDGRLGTRALDAMDARGQRFRAVVMIGLKEKLFPRQVLEDPLLRDGARSVLRHPAGYWIGRKAAGHEEERLLFYLAVASAKERLVLIYPRSDEAGKASVPSTYLRELCRAAGLPAPGEGDARRVPRQPAERLRSSPAGLLTPREASLLAVLEGGSPDPALDAAALAEGLRRVAALNDRGAPGAHDGLTRPIAAELAKLKASGLSPTALDLYATCPVRFFAARVLGLGDREEGSDKSELTPQARGLVYHAVLERFYSSLAEEVWAGKKDWAPAFDAAAAAVFGENDWRALGIYPLLWESARLDMSARLRSFIAWDLERLREAKIRPRLFETSLRGGPPEGAPGGVPWKGVADRIDADEAGGTFRVVDYKTRSSARWKNLAKQAAAGDLHQLPFYAELAGAAAGEGLSFGGAELLFLEVEEGEERSAALTAEDWGLARGPFLKILAERVEAIASGRFPIRPEDGERGHCSWCEFPTVCRKAHAPSRARGLRAPVPGA